jgi:hypothetical protein
LCDDLLREMYPHDVEVVMAAEVVPPANEPSRGASSGAPSSAEQGSSSGTLMFLS